MGKNMRLLLEMAEETKRLTMEGLEFKAAQRKVKEMYKEKAQSQATKQRKEHDKIFNHIIPPGTDIDNDQIYIEKTGEVLKDLI